MFKLERVSKQYKNGHWGLCEISFDMKPGEIICLAGPNGSGKTTLINTIFSVIKATTGEISFRGERNDSMYFKQHVVCVPDETILLELLTGKEYIEFVRSIYGASKERSEMLTDLFGMKSFVDNTISTYSHGMKKKIQFIAAFMVQADVMVLDEPYRGLDVEAVLILEKLMKNFVASGGSLLIASHDLHLAEVLCNRMIIISKGKMLDMASIQELKEKYKTDDIEKVFLKSSLLEENYEHIEKIIDDMYDHNNCMEKTG